MKFVVAVSSAMAMMAMGHTPSPLSFAGKYAKQIKAVAKQHARCEAMAYKSHVALGYEEWYIDEAMIFQSSECLATLVRDWFDQCENYCTSCDEAPQCQQSGNEECGWRNGVCKFGDPVTASFALTVTVTAEGGSISNFEVSAEDEPLKAAQQILNNICEAYPDVWAVLNEESYEDVTGGVEFTANVFQDSAAQAFAWKTYIDDLTTLGVHAWSATISSHRRLAGGHNFDGESTVTSIAYGSATCDGCALATECNAMDGCVHNGTCIAKPCTASTCSACGVDKLCVASPFCTFDGVCRGCSAFDCSGCCADTCAATEGCSWSNGQCDMTPCTRDSCVSCGTQDKCIDMTCVWADKKCGQPTSAPTTSAPTAADSPTDSPNN